MPFLDLRSKLGFDLDRWLLLQSGDTVYKNASNCHAFEKDWVECSHGIGQIRAKKECLVEFEDFYECMHRAKTLQRMRAIREQRSKLMKEGKYTPPLHHLGKGEPSP